MWNDIDRDLDKVATHRLPPGGERAVVSRSLAAAWMGAYAFVGLLVLFQLHWQAQFTALASLALVAAYPFMKRITWVAAGVAWAGVQLGGAGRLGRDDGGMGLAGALLYAGSICWAVGCDSIWRVAGSEDDALGRHPLQRCCAWGVMRARE